MNRLYGRAVPLGAYDVAVVMGTGSNKPLLNQAELLTPDASSACPNDLVFVVNADDEVIEKLLSEGERLLRVGPKGDGAGLTKAPVKCFRDAFDALQSLCV